MWPLAAALLLLSFQQSADPSAEGIKALEAEKYDEAAQHFTRAVEADPDDYAAHFHLALAHSLAGRHAEAITGYNKVLELKPGLYEAELNLGILLLGRKQARDAIPHLEAASAAKDDQFRPRMYLADALFEAGEYDRAAQSYSLAAALDPQSAAAELGLARALARQDRIADADPHFRTAARLDPGSDDALLELATLYEKDARIEDAIAIYRQFADNVAARERLGHLLAENGRLAEAIPHLEWAVLQSPTPANRLALAQAHRRNGEPLKGAAVLEQAVAAAPGDLDLRLAYGRELRDLRQFAAAARQFYAVVQRRPESLQAWNELAAMLISLGDYPQAMAALDRIQALGGETAGHLFFRAIILDKMKDYKRALDYYEKFLAASQGTSPNEEFQARQRARIIQKELSRR